MVPYEQVHSVALFKLPAVTFKFKGNEEEPQGGWKAGAGGGENSTNEMIQRMYISYGFSWV